MDKEATKKRTKRTRLAKGQELEVQHLTETMDLSPNQAKALLQRHGNDWAKIREEVENYKAKG
ncbi:hypothetical protein ACG873_07195 [Mesorhizobium sp. AaZ16]|uniref:hypothetical protein n=1 Tax=Mesorhizobium sp. AaZ16 TaxID=3402289 RepID=UPI00374FA292